MEILSYEMPQDDDNEKRLNCPGCGSSSYRKGGLSSKGKQKYICKNCYRYFQGEYEKLPPKVELPEGLKCPECNSKSCRKAGVSLNGKQKYECNNCGRYFQQECIKSKRTYKTRVPRIPGLTCPRCGSDDYIGGGHNPATGIRIYICKGCDSRFQDRYINKPLGVLVYKLKCPKCGSDNCRKEGFDHNGKQRYQCINCDKTFKENPEFVSASNILPEKITPEQMYEMDYWDMRVLGIKQNAANQHYTINFANISQCWLKNALKKWIKYRSTIDAMGTLADKMVSLRVFSKFLELRYPQLEPIHFNRNVVLDYFSYLMERKLSATGRHRKICNLRQLLEHCIRLNCLNIPREPLIFEEDYPQKPKRLPRYIPKEVLEQIDCNLYVLPKPIARMLMVIRESGMRVSELCNLKFDCIRQDAQGTWWLDYYRFKQKDEHTVPIRPEIAAVIQEQQQYIRDNLGTLFFKLFCETEGCTWFQNKTRKKDLRPRELDYFSPLAKEIAPETFRGYLYKLAVDKNIRDASGQIFPIQKVHQFRHTKATDMINNGVPIEQIKRYLGHASFSMTMVYAHIHDRTLKQQVEKYWDGGKVVNIAGELVKSVHPELETVDMQWFKKSVLAQALPNGYCGRPVVKGPCPHANACLTCSDFRTTKDFLGIHKEELEKTEKFIRKATANGWQRQVEMNEQVKKNLEDIIKGLEKNNE
ncbi:MAG: tyrosine-type recombinase/integrase [Rivularia sp. T60_A2020_040]|nr:tyrosine-type recombinase/integrase [Rivularia sp. T60_A2020_040]